MSEMLARLTAALADQYRIEREIGAGGMATVYLAEDIRHGRQVALKVLRPELAATLGNERFFREIQVAARLQHPHILPLHDSGEAGGFLYFVMPYVDGESLRDRLARVGELPVHDAVKILVEVVDALAYAHGQGVVHRDIKPDNVMLSGRHALVTDFGVAKAVSEATGRQQLTTAGVALGTPSYMAPEQAAADPNLDHRVDIYAVGAMAYELLTGRPPFTGMTSQQILAAHVTQTPDPVSRHRPTCPPALEAVVMRCLAKRAADRFQTAEELLNNLEPLATPSGGMTPTQTRPVTAWQEATGTRRWLPATLAAAAIVVAVLAWLALGRRPVAPLVQLERRQLTFSGTAAYPGISTDGKRVAYADRQCREDGYCTLDIIVQDIGGAGRATVMRDALAVWDIEWTPDDRYLIVSASFGAQWGVYSVPTLGGQRRFLGCCNGEVAGRGDTVLVAAGPVPADSVGWVRWVTASDGVVRDSVALPQSGLDPNGYLAQLFPDGERMLLVRWMPTGVTVVTATRAGAPIDSITLTRQEVPNSFTVSQDGRSVVGWLQRMFDRGEGDVLRYAIDRRGRIDPSPDTIARQLPGGAGLDLTPTGLLAYGSGPTEYSAWALRRSAANSMQFTQRRLAASTAFLGASISPTGDRVLLYRPVPGPDSRSQFSHMPFDSGPETPLGTPIQMEDFDWTQDGRGVVFVTLRGQDSVTIAETDVASGRSRLLGTAALRDYLRLETVAGGGVLIVGAGRTFRRLGVAGLSDSSFRLPDSLGLIERVDPAPDGRRFVGIGWSATGDSILLHQVSLVDGRATRLAAFLGEGFDVPRWLDDGTIQVLIRDTDWTSSWYSVPAGGGPPVRLGSPPRYPAIYRFSGDGRRVVARAEDQRTDIFLVPNFAEVLKK